MTSLITMNQNSHDDSLRQRKSKNSFTARVFQESTVSVISSIISTTYTPRKVFKIVVLLLCLIGFLYQTSIFIYYVLQYETVLNIDIEKPDFIDVPAYTFCDNNGIKRKAFCSKFPDRCFQPDDKFCSTHSHYCDLNKTLVPRKEYYYMEFNMTLNEILSFSKNLSELFIADMYRFNAEAAGPYLWPKNADHQGRSACYSMNLLVDSPEDPVQEKISFLFKRPINRLKFAVEEDDTFLPDSRPGILFAIHSPFEAINPFRTGYFLRAGREYDIHISMDKETLLPYPYETDCMNYTQEWKARNKTGPRSQGMCQHKCIFDLVLECYNCTVPFSVYPNAVPVCTDDTMGELRQNVTIHMEIDNCIEQCKEDCSKIKYSPVVQERFTVQYDDKGEITEDSKQYISVNVYLDEEEVVVLRRRAQYKTVEIYSNIGGFIGVWLGISLVQLMDFFETMGRIIYNFFKNRVSS